MTPLAFVEAGFPIIPVQIAPKPNGGWRKLPMAKWSLATTEPDTIAEWWRNWPDALPRVPLARMGWAVVDADGEEAKKKVTNIGCLGPHSAIDTPSGGKHLLFAQPDPPISKLTWCEDVEVLGTFCLLTCYDLEELKFPHVAPRAILPEMFRKPRAEGNACPERDPDIKRRAAKHDPVYVADLTAALWEMDATDWRGQHDEWLKLMSACRAEGIAQKDFVAWSLSDPHYAGDERLIRRKWESLRPRHGGVLFAALAERGIKVKVNGSSLIVGVPLRAPIPTRDWRSRINAILAVLRRKQDEPTLFWASCTIAEIIAETGKPAPSVASKLLEGACPGLRKEIGAEEVRRTIANGLRWVELKLLNEEENSQCATL